jgi:hypothetical protein
VKICLPKSKWYTKSKVILPNQKRVYNVLNLSDKVKILDVLNGGMPLPEVGCYEKNEPSITTQY